MPTFKVGIKDNRIIFYITVSAPSSDSQSGETYQALLDTGAQGTMVTEKVIQEVGLESVGVADITPASGKQFTAGRYAARLDVPIISRHKRPDGTDEVERFLRGMEIEVVALPYDPQAYDILLGMDFISAFHLTIFGGEATLSI